MYREEYSNITARYPDNTIRDVIVTHDGRKTGVRMNMSKPVTVKRMAEVAERLKVDAGVDFTMIRVHHIAFEYDDVGLGLSPEEIDGYVRCGDYIPCTTPIDKTYEYDLVTRTLRIWDRDELVYENANGVITADPVALADCAGIGI
ncbi:hypothetical protein [Conchiformibius steedae]|uniref:hypothetical protein n=1 Tax=Conchiformibius steedae TaxID=153493 RepID=UPI0026EC7A62|nr:hypothetical protein [Conchiformibius steedae]